MRRFGRIALLAAALAAAPAVWLGEWLLDGPAEANAALAVAYTLDELVKQSPEVVIATATERQSTWEKVGGSKRIVTYTKLEVSDDVYGGAPSVLWVRTLGGVVGKVGQHVAGEAQFTLGKRSVVFLLKTKDDTYVVSGAAQGHYPIVEAKDDEDKPRLALSPQRGTVVKKKKTQKTAMEVLNGAVVDAGVEKIREAKARVDAE